MILVTVGTHHQPFDRLVQAADALARAGERVVVQWGAASHPPRRCEGAAWMSPSELERLADQADVVISHAGPASLFLAWDRGLRPIVVPRRPELGEHVDDHQLRFVTHLAERAWVVHEVEGLAEAVARARGAVRGEPSGADRGVAFARRFGALADSLVSSAQVRRRGTLSRLARWVSAGCT